MEAVVAPNQPAANAGAVGQAQEQPRGESFFAIAKSLILRALIIYFITSMFRRPQTPTTGTGQTGTVQPRHSSSNLYANGTLMDLYVYVSENPEHPDFDNSDQLLWVLPNILYGEWTGGPHNDGTHEFETEIQLPATVQNNGSYYLHTYLFRNGDDPKTHLNHKYTIHRSKQLNKYKKRKYSKTVNLLTGTTTATQEEIEKAETIKEEIVSHWHPNITLNIINDYTAWTQGAVPPPLDQFVEFTADGEYYKPILYVNDYWNLAKDYQPINTTVKSVPLRITWQPLSMFKWQLYAAQSMRNQWSQGGPLGALLTGGEPQGDLDEEQDSLKEAMLDTNPYLLGLTIVVSIVHSVFEFLAFKNDIQFWRNRESLEGLSVRSVFFNVFQSVVVMLYVFDNDTNTLIRISCVIGLGIEIWKIHKVVNVKVDYENRLLGIIPLSITEKSSYVSSHTKEYDTQAFRYLSWALYPLLLGYAMYSLVYEEHKGWYSWILSMLYGFLLTFGFIMMTPQLFINYKLKSVAHLPWRMLTYKALNTFIDDIFAFIIRMPTLYRLGCFRDDIVFFIFLYQRWIYRVDPSRVNEFGYSQEMLEQSKGAQPDNAAAAAVGPPGEQETEQPKPLEEKKNE